MADEALDRAERDLIEMIVMIQRDYQKQIDPIVKRLAYIRALRPAPPIMIGASTDPNGWVAEVVANTTIGPHEAKHTLDWYESDLDALPIGTKLVPVGHLDRIKETNERGSD